MPRRNRAAWRVVVLAAGLAFATAPAADDDITRAIAALKAVDREGKSNDTAGLAWKALVKQGVPALFPTLEAIDDANPTATNWLRTAVGTIAEAEKAAGRPLPADKLEAFAKNTKYAPSARRLAYELLAAQDKSVPERLLPGFLNDTSPDLRYDAVAAELDKLEKSARPSVKTDLEKLLTFARDQKQLDRIVKKLEADYKVKVNVAEHLAFLTHWQLVGPFDSTQGKALTMSHPPESAKELAGKFTGKGGGEVAWKQQVTTDVYGTVDLNKAIGELHDATAYAGAVVAAEKATPAEIRVASPNAVQIFLNGQKLFEREEYHHGVNIDYHVGKGTLNAGPNLIVLKVAQNNQKEMWAQNWQFQLRVCDATGGLIPGLTQIVAEGGMVKSIKLGFIPPSADTKEDKK